MPVGSGISVRRVLSARRERVFDAWTRPELMTRWLFPGHDWTVMVTADVRVGGRYELAMLEADGSRHIQFGEYREIVAVSRIVFTWSCPELGVVDSVVTVVLADRGARTELLLTHELPPDPKIRRGHLDGWESCLDNLERLLTTSAERRMGMNSIKDEIRISAPASKAYEALTRQAGYRGWWNTVARVAESVGGEAQLRFDKGGTPVHMRFRIDEMSANERVRWTCVAHDHPDWVGTSLTWRLTDAGGAVVVALDHGDWRQDAPDAVAQGWKHFMGSLKAYVETGTGQPW